METAAHDLGEQDMGELAALIASRDRVYRFKAGRWIEKRQCLRPCEECGLDLPAAARANMRRHSHCNDRAHRRRSKPLAPKPSPSVQCAG
jgi:hypothetical protein